MGCPRLEETPEENDDGCHNDLRKYLEPWESKVARNPTMPKSLACLENYLKCATKIVKESSPRLPRRPIGFQIPLKKIWISVRESVRRVCPATCDRVPRIDSVVITGRACHHCCQSCSGSVLLAPWLVVLRWPLAHPRNKGHIGSNRKKEHGSSNSGRCSSGGSC